jgi:hypothetical protein
MAAEPMPPTRPAESEEPNETQRFLARRGGGVCLLLAGLLGLVGHADRAVLYHDEVIATFRGVEVLVFDYAARPLFYALAGLAVALFGSDPHSLALLALLAYLATAGVIYNGVARHASPEAGLLAAFAFSASPLVLEHGLQGMPHGVLGLWIAVSVVLVLAAVGAPREPRARAWYFAAGLAAAAGLATHPTAVSYVVAVAAWVAAVWTVWVVRRRSRTFVAMLASPPLFMAAGFAAGVATLEVLYRAAGAGGYLSTFLFLTGRVQLDEQFVRYHQPWHYYPQVVAQDGVLASLLLLALTAWLVAVAVGRPVEGGRVTHGLAMVATVTLLSLSVLSLSEWKFERVLVALVPLLALSIGMLWGGAQRMLGQRARALLTVSTLAAIMVLTPWSVVRSLAAIERVALGKGAKYTGFFEVLDHGVRGERIGYVGAPRSDLARRLHRFVRVAGKEWVALGPLPAVEDDARLLEERLLTEDIDHLLIATEELAPGRVERWDAELRRLDLHRAYRYEDRAEIWGISLAAEEGELGALLAAMPRRGVVALLRTNEGRRGVEEISAERLISTAALRPYSMPIERQPARHIEYVLRNRVRHVLLWDAGGAEAVAAANAALRESLAALGGQPVGEGTEGLQLWTLPPVEELISEGLESAGPAVIEPLRQLAPRSRVGVLGTAAELGEPTSTGRTVLLVGLDLADYRLGLDRSPKRQRYYLERNDVRYVIVQAAGRQDGLPPQARDFVSSLEQGGGRQIATSQDDTFELWELLPVR